ncbi:hypothetical protein DBO95_26140, partial [Yersinia pestis]
FPHSVWRLLYAAIASISHHQERQSQQIELSVEGEPPGPHQTDLSP